MTRSIYGFIPALLLLGVFSTAAPEAHGEESVGQATRTTAGPAETSRSRAADAQREAVSSAADAVVSATRTELDIRLVSHTSIQVASDLR